VRLKIRDLNSCLAGKCLTVFPLVLVFIWKRA